MVHEITISKLDPNDVSAINKIAEWYFEEWQTPIDKTIKRLSSQPGDDVLFQLVLRKGDEIIATCGLCNNVNLLNVHEEFNKFKPWLALFYTEKKFRKQGLGKMLLDEMDKISKENNLTKMYLYTATAESLYRRCGWKEIARVNYKDMDTVVMEKVV